MMKTEECGQMLLFGDRVEPGDKVEKKEEVESEEVYSKDRHPLIEWLLNFERRVVNE